MRVERLIPILNVTNIQESFAWFEKFGWTKAWDWGEPVSFGGVALDHVEIYMSEGTQGGRGRGGNAMTFGPKGDEEADRGVWMWIAVDDVDAVHARCVEHGLDVTWPPTDMPWNSREMHVRHPDGHVFRVGKGLE